MDSTHAFDNMTKVRNLGKGTYAFVDSYRLMSGELVAVKKMLSNDNGILSTTIREIHAMKSLEGCQNILQLLGIEAKIEDGETKIRLMLTYHTSDLDKFCIVVPVFERIKYSSIIIRQLLNGLYQMYNRDIMHRDIKPGNILIDYEYSRETNSLLSEPRCYLADFGLSRQFPCDKKFTDGMLTKEVYTGIYRPPELFFDDYHYNDNADIWALGLTIIEYFTGKDMFVDDNDEQILNQILLDLNKPLAPSPNNKLKLQKGEIHDYIAFDRFMEKNMSPFHYDLIPKETTILLSQMLQVNPDDRAHISQLIQNPTICDYKSTIDRGPIRGTSINTRMMIIVVLWIIDISKMFKLKIRTVLGALDMLQRIVANYSIERSDLQLTSIGCVSLMSKLNEIYSPEINDYIFVAEDFEAQQIKDSELIVLEQMNYMIASCEIDSLVSKINSIDNHKLQYPVMRKLFFIIYSNKIYVGTLPYSIIEQYCDQLIQDISTLSYGDALMYLNVQY